MSSAQLQLADAIVAAINASSYAQTVKAARADIEELPLEDMGSGLYVSVLPGTSEEVPATFDGTWLDTVVIDVELRARVAAATPAATDALATLAQLVFDAVKAGTYSKAVFIKAEKSPPANYADLREKFLWGTGATFTFQLVS